MSLSVPPWSFEGFLAVVVAINAGKEAEAQSQSAAVCARAGLRDVLTRGL